MRTWFLVSLIMLSLSGCAPGGWSNRLPYAGPVEVSIGQGEFLPGADIQYVGQTEDGAQTLIGGKQALKKVGDSLNWKGDVLRGVRLDQTLRVVHISEEALRAAGTVRVTVLNPTPQAEKVNRAAPVHFKLPAGYHVKRDEAIPGTPITYLGQTDEGAYLGDIEGYAYRQPGDSILWEGKLRDGVWVRLDLRAVVITDEMLDVVGTAELWIEPPGEGEGQ